MMHFWKFYQRKRMLIFLQGIRQYLIYMRLGISTALNDACNRMENNISMRSDSAFVRTLRDSRFLQLAIPIFYSPRTYKDERALRIRVNGTCIAITSTDKGPTRCRQSNYFTASVGPRVRGEHEYSQGRGHLYALERISYVASVKTEKDRREASKRFLSRHATKTWDDYYLTGISDVRVNFHKIVIDLLSFLPARRKENVTSLWSRVR